MKCDRSTWSVTRNSRNIFNQFYKDLPKSSEMFHKKVGELVELRGRTRPAPNFHGPIEESYIRSVQAHDFIAAVVRTS